MSAKKDNSAVKAALIGGVVTIIATVLSAIAAPLILERMKPTATLAPTSILISLPATVISTDMPLIPTSTLQISQTEQIQLAANAPAQSHGLEKFIYAYYQAINDRNYELTWSLLSDTFRAYFHSPAKGGYQGYVDFWNTVDRVEVQETNILEQSSQFAKVFIAASYHYKSGATTTSRRNFYFLYDFTRNTWVFDVSR